jgi:transposase-like protein
LFGDSPTLKGSVPVQLKGEKRLEELRNPSDEEFGARDLKKERRNWSAEEKTKLLRRHLVEKVPISKICEEAQLAPSLFHYWQERLFVNAALALEGKRPERSHDQQRIEKLESKMRQKDEVLAELMAEHVALKKEFGEL